MTTGRRLPEAPATPGGVTCQHRLAPLPLLAASPSKARAFLDAAGGGRAVSWRLRLRHRNARWPVRSAVARAVLHFRRRCAMATTVTVVVLELLVLTIQCRFTAPLPCSTSPPHRSTAPPLHCPTPLLHCSTLHDVLRRTLRSTLQYAAFSVCWLRCSARAASGLLQPLICLCVSNDLCFSCTLKCVFVRACRPDEAMQLCYERPERFPRGAAGGRLT